MKKYLVVLALSLATSASAQSWKVDTNWKYEPEKPFEVGKMYWHSYLSQIYVLGEMKKLGGDKVLIIQVIERGPFVLCGDIETKVCGIPADTPRSVWQEMIFDDGTK